MHPNYLRYVEQRIPIIVSQINKSFLYINNSLMTNLTLFDLCFFPKDNYVHLVIILGLVCAL